MDTEYTTKRAIQSNNPQSVDTTISSFHTEQTNTKPAKIPKILSTDLEPAIELLKASLSSQIPSSNAAEDQRIPTNAQRNPKMVGESDENLSSVSYKLKENINRRDESVNLNAGRQLYIVKKDRYSEKDDFRGCSRGSRQRKSSAAPKNKPEIGRAHV